MPIVFISITLFQVIEVDVVKDETFDGCCGLKVICAYHWQQDIPRTRAIISLV
jgi:hypothetical protein